MKLIFSGWEEMAIGKIKNHTRPLVGGLVRLLVGPLVIVGPLVGKFFGQWFAFGGSLG